MESRTKTQKTKRRYSPQKPDTTLTVAVVWLVSDRDEELSQLSSKRKNRRKSDTKSLQIKFFLILTLHFELEWPFTQPSTMTFIMNSI